ncbi:MAG: hypothetical protein EOO41_02890 [Methanobacteriota archaeon]|nr:MAG: hypothetical protein EOO41_02890 [Euryarchaeota archaeon]
MSSGTDEGVSVVDALRAEGIVQTDEAEDADDWWLPADVAAPPDAYPRLYPTPTGWSLASPDHTALHAHILSGTSRLPVTPWPSMVQSVFIACASAGELPFAPAAPVASTATAGIAGVSAASPLAARVGTCIVGEVTSAHLSDLASASLVPLPTSVVRPTALGAQLPSTADASNAAIALNGAFDLRRLGTALAVLGLALPDAGVAALARKYDDGTGLCRAAAFYRLVDDVLQQLWEADRLGVTNLAEARIRAALKVRCACGGGACVVRTRARVRMHTPHPRATA